VGNVGLTPEKGATTTYGGVYKPSWLPGFQGSLDYYKVTITDAIATPTPTAIVDGCFRGDQQLCKLITFGTAPVTNTTQIPAGAVGVTIRGATQNVATQSTSGLDIALDYTRPLANGAVNFSVLGNYLLTAKDSGLAAAGVTRLVGSLDQGVSYPRWTSSFSAEYRGQKYALFLQERLISKGKRNANLVEGLDISTNKVPMISYTDVTATYNFESFGSQDELFFSVSNLFDQDPPSTATATSNSLTPTNFSLYDILGRRFTLGFRFRM
jgi:hypothetical protein